MFNNINFRNLIILILAFIVFSNLRVSAQYDSQFEKLTIKDGLSSNDVWDVIQDKYGLLWIATKDGINIYDGYNFKILKHSPEDSTSLPSNDCNSLLEDQNHEIWIGTKVGLARYNRVNETFVNYQFTTNNTEFANSVSKIFEDSQNNLWVTTNQGILLFDRTTKKFKKFDVMKIDNTVTQMISNTIGVFETKKGELFIGSNEYGLLKYDYSSQIFAQLNLLKGIKLLIGNQTYDIKEDKEGNLWLATFRGLMKVDLDNMLCKDITPFEKVLINQGGARNSFYGVYKDRFDNIWAGTNSYGIYVFNSSTEDFKLIYDNKTTNPTGPFYEDRFGIIWAATIQGLWKYDLDKKPFDLVLPANFSEDENNPIIFSFNESKKFNKKIWLGSSIGLNLYNMETKKIEVSSPLLNKINFPNNNSISTALEENDNLWYGTITSGLFKFNLSTNKLENFLMRYYDYSTINNNRINSLLDTENDDLWIATNFGINIINKRLNKISSVPSLMSRQYDPKLKLTLQSLIQKSKPITSIISVGDYADISKEFVLTKDENVIISVMGEGLIANNMVDYGWLESESGETIWTCSNIDSTYFAGGNGKNRTKIGMLKLKKGRYKLRYISDDSHSAKSFNAPPPEDTLSWGITMYSLSSEQYNSLEKIYIKDNSTTYMSGHNVFKLILTSDNSIWAATNQGVSKINSETHEVVNYRKNKSTNNSLSSELINDIVEDLNGNIWIATEDGLNMLEPKSGRITILRDQSGLPTNNIRSAQIDNSGDLWVSSSNGVSKIEISAGYDSPVIINYDVKDGLQGYEFLHGASYKDSEGRLYFSGTEGFNTFMPGKSNSSLPYIALNNVLISNKSIKDSDYNILKGVSINELNELSLPHDQNDLSFDFVSIHYSRPDKNRLQYKMDGVDDDWILSDRRFASYTNMNPGDYVFNIKGSNGDGIWNENIRKINIHISPPWYNNWTAYTIYVALFLGLLFSIRKSEMRRQQKNSLLKESQLKIETAEAMAKAAESEKRALQVEYDHKKKELDEARELQLSMLPRNLPQIPHLDIAVYMKTATEVGGDYYDFHIGLDGTLTVVLGDATGHGMKAGTMVTTTKSLFNVLAPNPNIVDTFHEMTRCLKLMQMQNLSMCMTMLKIAGNRLQMSAAGMPPIFIYKRENQSTEEHVIKGMPLGTFNNFPYKIIESELNSGDTILLMSDGFPELLNDDNEIFGYKRARNLFEDLANESPENIITKLKDAGSEWVNDKDPDDDVTFVVIKVK